MISVTGAGRSHSEDLAARQRRYVLTQLVRLVCFVSAVLIPMPLAARLVLIGAGIVLPLMGVVAANAGPIVERRRVGTLLPHPEINQVSPEALLGSPQSRVAPERPRVIEPEE